MSTGAQDLALRFSAAALDANGNTTTKTDSTGTTTYAWDFENRLTSVILPASGGTVAFKYDPFGRRIYKSSTSATSIYAYDDDNLIEETNSSGVAVARYSQGSNFDEPLAMLRSGATSYYQADGLDSVTSLTNAAGTAAQSYTYDSFGNLLASSGTLVNNFRYTGREFDSETGLYYYRARYYDPATGRFLGEDPIGFAGSGSNFYAYVGNSVTNFRDPSGLDPSLWQRLINWLWPSPAPSTSSSPSCPSPRPGFVPPWLPIRQFNRFKPGPSSGPYRPNAGPQNPEGPINPTEPPPVIDPPPPGGLPETIEPTPFRPSPETPSDPDFVPGLRAVADFLGAVLRALSNASDPMIVPIMPCDSSKHCT